MTTRMAKAHAKPVNLLRQILDLMDDWGAHFDCTMGDWAEHNWSTELSNWYTEASNVVAASKNWPPHENDESGHCEGCLSSPRNGP